MLAVHYKALVGKRLSVVVRRGLSVVRWMLSVLRPSSVVGCSLSIVRRLSLSQSCSQHSTSQVPVPVLESEVPVQVPVLEIDIMFLLKTAKVEINSASALL